MDKTIQGKLDLLFDEFNQKVEKIKEEAKDKHEGILIFGNTDEENQKFEQAVAELKADCEAIFDEIKAEEPKIKIPNGLLIVGDIGPGLSILGVELTESGIELLDDVNVGAQSIISEEPRGRLDNLITQAALMAYEEIPDLRALILSEDHFQISEWRQKRKPKNYKAVLNRHKFLPSGVHTRREFLQNRG